MRYILDHDFHIHSKLSNCSQHPKQTPERILKYGEDNGFHTICITDHFWDEKVFDAGVWVNAGYDLISKSLPLPQSENTKFLFGCEVDMRKDNVIGISCENYDKFDFIIIPTTHMHFVGFTISEEQAENTKTRARAWLDRLNAILDMELPFHKVGIAHLATTLTAATKEEAYEVFDILPEDELEFLFAKAAEKGVGIELNADDFKFPKEKAQSVLRIFKTAKKMGCKFYLGSDAHTPKGLEEAPYYFEKAVELLSLTEDDKFHIK